MSLGEEKNKKKTHRKKLTAKEESEQRSLTAKKTHSKKISQRRSTLTTKMVHSKKNSQRRSFTAKTNHSKEESQQRSLTWKRVHSKKKCPTAKNKKNHSKEGSQQKNHSWETSQQRKITAKKNHSGNFTANQAHSHRNRTAKKAHNKFTNRFPLFQVFNPKNVYVCTYHHLSNETQEYCEETQMQACIPFIRNGANEVGYTGYTNSGTSSEASEHNMCAQTLPNVWYKSPTHTERNPNWIQGTHQKVQKDPKGIIMWGGFP